MKIKVSLVSVLTNIKKKSSVFNADVWLILITWSIGSKSWEMIFSVSESLFLEVFYCKSTSIIIFFSIVFILYNISIFSNDSW